MSGPSGIAWHPRHPPLEGEMDEACGRLRAHGVALSTADGRSLLVGDAALAAQVLEGEAFSSAIMGDGGVPMRCPRTGAAVRPRDTLLASDGAQHARLRAVVIDALRDGEPRPAALAANAAQMAARLRRRDSCEFVADFAIPFSDRAAAATLGIPDGELADFAHEVEAMWEALAGRLGDRARFEGAMSRMVDRLHRALSAEDGAVTAAAALGRAWRAGHCSALEALGMAVAILQGMTRTSAMLAAGALRDGLLRCEARFPAHESAQRWVERALRERPPVHTITRIALREARLGTHVVPAGTPVAVCLRALRGDRLWAFGHGPHACPGGRTGQAAAAAMVAAILDRLPGLRIDESACGPRPSHPIFSEPTRLPLRWTPA